MPAGINRRRQSNSTSCNNDFVVIPNQFAAVSETEVLAFRLPVGSWEALCSTVDGSHFCWKVRSRTSQLTRPYVLRPALSYHQVLLPIAYIATQANKKKEAVINQPSLSLCLFDLHPPRSRRLAANF